MILVKYFGKINYNCLLFVIFDKGCLGKVIICNLFWINIYYLLVIIIFYWIMN